MKHKQLCLSNFLYPTPREMKFGIWHLTRDTTRITENQREAGVIQTAQRKEHHQKHNTVVDYMIKDANTSKSQQRGFL